MANTPYIVFDCDGTLTDSHHSIVEAMRRTFADVGRPEPGDMAVRSVIGLSLPQAIAQLVPEPDALLHDELAEKYKVHFQMMRRAGEITDTLYPGVPEALAALKNAGALMGVATGKSYRGLHHVLEQYDLLPYFVSLQTADTNASKPHPEMLEVAMAEAGATPENTLMIGDSPYDIHMARAAGTASAGVAWSDHGTASLLRAGADHILNSYADWSQLLTVDRAAA